MLSSRYLYLHEALDLGPMWLQQGASVRTEESDHARADTVPAPQSAKSVPTGPAAGLQTASEPTFPHTAPHAQSAPAPNHRPRKTAITPAHAAVMAAIGSRSALNQTAAETPDSGHVQTAQSSAAPPPAPRLCSPVTPAKLLAISICPSLEDMAAGRLFCGADGILLDNMLSAIGLMPSAACRLSWLEQLAFQPSAAEMQAEIPRLQEAVRQSGAQAVLLLGQFFSQDEPQKLLQQAFGPLPLFVVPHPARLLRQPQLKAQAWAELKKLRALAL